MKNSNIEQQLADKLGNRSITPGKQAWSRIAYNRQQVHKKKSKAAYYYVAAAVACLFAVGIVYLMLSGNGTVIVPPQVVYTNATDTVNQATEPINPKRGLQAPKVQTVVLGSKIKQEVNSGTVRHKQAEVIELNPNTIKPVTNPQQIHSVVLAELKAPSKEERYEQEATLLLANATKQLVADKNLLVPTNDTALLKEVEAEMEEYYREKTMKIFSLKHKTIRIAVKDKH